MKKQLLTAVAVLASLCGFAQTQGTNTLGLGVSVNQNRSESNDGFEINSSKDNLSTFLLSYGYFIKDNQKLFVNLNYSKNKLSYTDYPRSININVYGGSVGYQHYFPLLNSFYAYAAGSGGYNHTRNDKSENNNEYNHNVRRNEYYLNGSGGLAWFFSEHFAIEADLISLNASYADFKATTSTLQAFSSQNNKARTFNLSSQGAINNLGFRIYFLF